MRLLNYGILLLSMVSVGVAAEAASPGPADEAPAVVTLPAKAYGPDFSLPSPSPSLQQETAGGITEYDLSLGCIVGGTTGTALSLSAGGMNVVNLIAGGLVPASSPVAMWVALGGVVFASFCSVGQAVTPTVLAAYAYFVPPVPVRQSLSTDARYCQAALPPSRSVTGRLLPPVQFFAERM